MRKEKGEPTPNRVQSTDVGASAKISLLNLCRSTRKKTRLSLLELPRCEGGKDRKAGLKEKEPCGTILVYLGNYLVYSYLVYSST